MIDDIPESQRTIIAKQFLALRLRRDVAALLGIERSQLNRLLYHIAPGIRYRKFTITKKSGNQREIRAPIGPLKHIQRKLADILYIVYKPKPSVHGFALGQSVATNAAQHIKARYVFNLDLLDFFPSINFGRVRGMFMAPPYEISSEAATVLAQICCFENQLPQGAPTSPIVANMICARLDSDLQRFAGKLHCRYTRYADDITLSKLKHSMPNEVCQIEKGGVAVGLPLKAIIERNGFQINPSKVRLQSNKVRQSVTGLVVNTRVNVERSYVRQIRAMIYAWKKFGLDAAAAEHANKFHKPDHKDYPVDFKSLLRGKISYVRMVKGANDAVVKNLQKQLAGVDAEYWEYLVRENEKATEFDVFVSHASEDKESFVRPLAKELVRIGLRVWFDEFELKIGDSLHQKIDHGLLKSKYGVVVLSKCFFLKKWTKKELDGLVALERNGRKVILPVWYGVGEEYVAQRSPMLAGLYALDQKGKSIEEVARLLKESVDSKSSRK